MMQLDAVKKKQSTKEIVDWEGKSPKDKCEEHNPKPSGGRGITLFPGSLTASLSCGIKPRSRSLRRSLSHISDRRQPPSMTWAAATHFLPPAALVPTAEEDFLGFPIMMRRRRRQD